MKIKQMSLFKFSFHNKIKPVKQRCSINFVYAKIMPFTFLIYADLVLTCCESLKKLKKKKKKKKGCG